MVAIHQFLDDSPLPTESLHNVLNESLDDYSEGSTTTVSSCPTFPPGFGGIIFHVSHNSVTNDGETVEECKARLAKNTDCQRRRDAEVAQGANEDGRSPSHINVIWKRHLTWWAIS